MSRKSDSISELLEQKNKKYLDGRSSKAKEEVFNDLKGEETNKDSQQDILESKKEEGEGSINIDNKKESQTVKKRGRHVERKQVAWNLRKDLHREYKMITVMNEDVTMYELIEEAMEAYLPELKKKYLGE